VSSTLDTAKQIWKYPLGNGSPQEIAMPEHADILTVQNQDGHACLWVMVNPQNDKVKRRIHIIGTGHDMPSEETLSYIGTIQQGIFVWHIFEDFP
jgi:hypothetical protein